MKHYIKLSLFSFLFTVCMVSCNKEPEEQKYSMAADKEQSAAIKLKPMTGADTLAPKESNSK